jgi:hypothetical protein
MLPPCPFGGLGPMGRGRRFGPCPYGGSGPMARELINDSQLLND